VREKKYKKFVFVQKHVCRYHELFQFICTFISAHIFFPWKDFVSNRHCVISFDDGAVGGARRGLVIRPGCGARVQIRANARAAVGVACATLAASGAEDHARTHRAPQLPRPIGRRQKEGLGGWRRYAVNARGH
jgi:hypothetical protein